MVDLIDTQIKRLLAEIATADPERTKLLAESVEILSRARERF